MTIFYVFLHPGHPGFAKFFNLTWSPCWNCSDRGSAGVAQSEITNVDLLYIANENANIWFEMIPDVYSSKNESYIISV